jgi:transposase
MEPDEADQAENPRAGRQRHVWSAEEKRRIVAESFRLGTSVSKVAQRYGLNANLLFTWRRQEARRSAFGDCEAPVKLLPVTVAAAGTLAAPAAASEPAGRMEIVLTGGERIVVGADVDASSLARVVKALSRR